MVVRNAFVINNGRLRWSARRQPSNLNFGLSQVGPSWAKISIITVVFSVNEPRAMIWMAEFLPYLLARKHRTGFEQSFYRFYPVYEGQS
jgi:hypothetical protein